MAITPLPGWIVDSTGHGVIRDPNAAPNPMMGGTGVPPAPISTPTVTPPSSGTQTPPTSTAGQPSPSQPTQNLLSEAEQKMLAVGVTPEEIAAMKTDQGLDPLSFKSMLLRIQQKANLNNDLIAQRSLLVKQLFDTPLTPDELAKLPGDVRQSVQGGDRNQIELELRSINDQISGRAQSLNQYVKYITQDYDTAIQEADKKKTEAFTQAKDLLNMTPSAVVRTWPVSYQNQIEKALNMPLGSLSSPSFQTEKDIATQGAQAAREQNALLRQEQIDLNRQRLDDTERKKKESAMTAELNKIKQYTTSPKQVSGGGPIGAIVSPFGVDLSTWTYTDPATRTTHIAHSETEANQLQAEAVSKANANVYSKYLNQPATAVIPTGQELPDGTTATAPTTLYLQEDGTYDVSQ